MTTMIYRKILAPLESNFKVNLTFHYQVNCTPISYDIKTIGIEPLKANHDITKLELTIPLLSLICIEINLSIQLISFTLYMIWVH